MVLSDAMSHDAFPEVTGEMIMGDGWPSVRNEMY